MTVLPVTCPDCAATIPDGCAIRDTGVVKIEVFLNKKCASHWCRASGDNRGLSS